MTEPQQRALAKLARLSEDDPTRNRARERTGMPAVWFPTNRFCRSTRTAVALERLGYVSLRLRVRSAYLGARLSGSMYEAKLTDEGRAVASMAG